MPDTSNLSISEAILSGRSFTPSEFPTSGFAALSAAGSIPELAFEALAPYFAGDKLFSPLAEICCEAFDFPIPIAEVAPNCRALELFAGPGQSYIDFGARFIVSIMQRLNPGAVLTAEIHKPSEAAAWARALAGKEMTLFLTGVKECPGLPQNVSVCDSAPAGAICVDERNTAFIMGLSVPFIYCALHQAISEDRIRPSKEIFLTHFALPACNQALQAAVFFARAIGAPIGRVLLACRKDHGIKAFLDGKAPAPAVLGLLLKYFSEQEVKETVLAGTPDDEAVGQAIQRVTEKTGYCLSSHGAVLEAARFALLPVHRTVLAVTEPQ